ncbi:MAG: LLM class F420-dependent oxidoreductase [Acidimicrobiales bacterium]
MRARIFVEPQQGSTYEQQLAVAQSAEKLGFDAFFRSDHFLTMSGDGMPGPTDSWVTLAGIARETDRIRLGTLLTSATFRLPSILAISVAEVDAMSGGRVELGLGAGWFEDEHTSYGIPFPSVRERFERLGEQLEIITGLWDTPPGEKFSFDGRHYKLTDSPALPKPVQSPHPPIIIGGGGAKRTPELAARFGSEFNLPFFPPSDAERQYALVRAACERIGRDPGDLIYSAASTVCCGRDEPEIQRRADRIGTPLDQLRQFATAGTPDQVVERLRQFGEAGAEVVYLQVLDMSDLDHLGLLGEEVLPHL